MILHSARPEGPARPQQTRRSSVYVLMVGITDPGAAERALKGLLSRVHGPTLAGSGVDHRGCFVRLRLAGDDAAIAAARNLTMAFGQPRYTSPTTLSTGLGAHYRTIEF